MIRQNGFYISVTAVLIKTLYYKVIKRLDVISVLNPSH